MKALIRSAQNLPHSFANPLHAAALPLFFALAFLPALLHLATFTVPVTNPLVVPGPVVAGFWLAAGVREICVSFALLGTLITTLIWTANWLMMAGGGCCSTLANS
jgi:hypothetical protein